MLGILRDVSVLILGLEWFILALIPLFLLYVCVRGMWRLLPKMREWLTIGRAYVTMGLEFVERVMRWLLAPVLFLSGLAAGLRQGVAALKRR
jgi:hypothetical protein